MQAAAPGRPKVLLARVGWWAFVLIIVFYGAFALTMGISELLFLLGVAPEMKHRAAPLVFSIHAFAGATVLLIAPFQSTRWIRRRGHLRRTLGRTYVVAVWVASLAAMVDARTFDVSTAAKIIFVVIAMLWFGTTTVGFLLARARRFAEQHEWMIRSYSLSLFFLTFSLWAPAMAGTSLPPDLAYSLAQCLSAALNFAVAELWIRHARPSRRPALVRTTARSASALVG